MQPEPVLKRALTLPLIVLYGLGTTIGAGIFVLLGEVAGRAGALAPLSFVIAGMVAAPTAFSFAELSSRLPHAAGEARYVLEGLRARWLAAAVGLLVVFAGIVSGATIVRGTAGYIAAFLDIPITWIAAAVVVLLTLIAVWGIVQSVSIAALFTLVEIGALLAVIVAGADDALAGLPRLGEALPASSAAVFTGAFIAFFAYIGFEGIANIAEESKQAERVLPVAILITLGVTIVLYVAVALIAVAAIPIADLAASSAPIALLFARTTGISGEPIAFVAIFSVANGALIQILLSARVIYGLSRSRLLPSGWARVHPRTQTPVRATLGIGALMLAPATFVQIGMLAEIASFATLAVFALVNLALIALKRREARHGKRASIAVPSLGFAASCAAVLFLLARV